MKFHYREIHGLEDAQRNFEQIEQQGIFVGAGLPTFQAKQGNVYIRTDTPSTANQRIYMNTADGSHWTGIL